MAAAAATTRTYLAFQHNAKLHKLKTLVTAIRPFLDLEEANRQLFKDGSNQDHVVVTKETIFHPQGGGQPSDVGSMTAFTGAASLLFSVKSVRMDFVHDGQVLHLGRFVTRSGCGSGSDSNSNATTTMTTFQQGDEVEQAIDVEKRLLYSRYHTAGHVLGAAVRHLLEKEVDGFDELKASHFPDSASCEFQGLIDGKHKDAIQQKVNAFLDAKMPVKVHFWDEEDFRTRGLERLIPDRKDLAPSGNSCKFRVVEIVGAEVYPCGGTHVDSTDLCGETTVTKISRSKGKSKVSYAVATATTAP